MLEQGNHKCNKVVPGEEDDEVRRHGLSPAYAVGLTRADNSRGGGWEGGSGEGRRHPVGPGEMTEGSRQQSGALLLDAAARPMPCSLAYAIGQLLLSRAVGGS